MRLELFDRNRKRQTDLRQALGAQLVRFARHPKQALALMAIVTVAAGALAAKLSFESSYLALLPAHSPEVAAIDAVRRYTGGTNELVVAIGGREAARLPFARRITARLNRLPVVQWAELEFPVGFFEKGGLLLLPTEALAELHQRLSQEINLAKLKANPLALELDEDEGAKPEAQPAGLAVALRQQIERRLGGPLRRTRTTADGRYLMMLVRPKAASSELAEGKRVLAEIQAVIDSERSRDDGLQVRLGGSLLVNQAEHRTMSADLALASLLALVFAVGLLTLVTRRAKTLAIIALPLVVGLVVTLALAKLLIGHLNLVSGFMVAALVGLGVDFGIHLHLRYLDERAGNPALAPGDAMGAAIRATFPACLTSALTTAVAFFALLMADFRGFSEYGLIAGVGVIVMLVTTFAFLPALGLLLGPTPGAADRSGQRRLDNVRPLSRPLAWAMVASALALALFSAARVPEARFYNDFKKLKGNSEALRFDDYLTRELGGSLAPAVVMVDSLDAARRAEAVAGKHLAMKVGGIERALSLATLMPKASSEQRELLRRIRASAEQALQLGALRAEDAVALRLVYEATTAQPWDQAAVPGFFRTRLVGHSGGSSKYFLLLWPHSELRDDRVISVWAAELRSFGEDLRRAGISAQILDENLIAARVVELIRADGPRVLWGAALAVLFLLIVDLRRPREVLLAAGSVLVGLGTMVGLMVGFGLQLNLFNAVVLPTVLGIGIDNAVHVLHAYRERGRGSLALVMATSGRAALLSSATTAVGFGSAVVAHHLGLHQMALLALLGVGTTFLCSTVVLPALLRLAEGTGAQLADAGRVAEADSELETVRLPALPAPQISTSSPNWASSSQ